MTINASRLVELALLVGRTPASGPNLPATLRDVCAELPEALDVGGAVIMVSDAIDQAVTSVFSSDPRSEWLGEVQRRARRGPLPDALASGRSMMTPDLTRIGPPELAAASAECGLTSSMVVLLGYGDHRPGVLQLLGAPGRPAAAEHADAVRVVAEALGARLVDVAVLRRLSEPVPSLAAGPAASTVNGSREPATSVDPADVATAAIDVAHRLPVPHPRSPRPTARHRGSDVDPVSGASFQPETSRRVPGHRYRTDAAPSSPTVGPPRHTG